MAIIITHETKQKSSFPCYLDPAHDGTRTSVKSSFHEERSQDGRGEAG